MLSRFFFFFFVLLIVIAQSFASSETYFECPVSDAYYSAADTYNTSIQSEETLHKGWPVSLSTPGAGFPYTATLFDIDGDGSEEIFLTGGHTFALNGDGTFLTGWPTTEQLYMGYATNDQMAGPSVADLDDDGSIEILWSLRDWYAGSAHIWTFNGKRADGSNISGFPEDAPDQSSNALNSPFVLGDSDKDGNLEAWTAHTLGNTGDYYRISCKDHEGNLVFTRDFDPATQIEGLFFGDADGDSSEEFFAVTLVSGELKLHLFNSDGSDQTGYPQNLFSIGSGNLMFGPPLAADLDSDGDLEIIIGHYSSGVSYASAYNHDGAVVTDFPITIATSSQLFYLGLGDVTADGTPELIATDNHLSQDYRVHIIDISTGSPLSGWPIAQSNWPEGLPTVVDIDSDGYQDVCFVTDGGELFAFATDASVIEGYPRMMSAPSISGVAAGDIDGDGYYELVATTWDGFVYAWDTEGIITSDNADWPMRGVDSRNTGIYRGATIGGIETSPEFVQTLTISANPVSSSVLFTTTLQQNSSLTIYDISGKQIINLPTVSNTFYWTPNRFIPDGVYFASLNNSENTTVKFVLAR